MSPADSPRPSAAAPKAFAMTMPRRSEIRPPSQHCEDAPGSDRLRTVGVDAIPALASMIWDESRARPLVVLTPVPGYRTRHLLDPNRLSAAIGDGGDLVVLADHDATQALCAALPDGLRFGTGSARVFHPGATSRDHPRRHPWVFVDREHPERAVDRIVACLQAPPPAWSSSDNRPAWTDRAEPVRAAPLERDLTEAKSRISILAKEKKRLSREVADLRAGRTGSESLIVPEAFTDPERQLRYEVEQLWLWTHPENERAEHPLADFDTGPDWFDSLEAIQVVDRSAVLSAVIDVLSGRVVAKNGRRVHRQRVGKGGSTAPLVRADGAVGWRCDIRSATPAAPRLLWWALPDGRIELAKATVHNGATH